MKVLSLFDGISCCRVALERANIQVDKYYASEIDKYAIQVAQNNYPDTIQLGDINNWRNWKIDWASIDLVAGGSPCQGFSNAGKGLNFDDPRSALFFVFVDIINHIRNVNPNVKFLLENVKMKKEWLDIISKWLNVEPVEINSSLVSAQNRQRFYWTNIAKIPQPEDKHIYLKDILISNDKKNVLIQTNVDKTLCVNSQSGDRYGKRKQPSLSDRIYNINGKNPALTASYQTKIAEPIKYLNEKNLQHLMRDFGSKGKILCDKDEKTNTLTASMGMGGGNGLYYAEQKTEKNVFEVKDKKVIIYDKEYQMDLEDGFWCFRKLTPIECERLQTLPDNYTDGISNSQRYKALGNGWTVDIIAHIFSFLPNKGR
ncbi:MAG: DNA cytosine methyltransferase [Clostridia bacterium]|nr:DNA cytosine methyltransferase [Clostridia bacterium]